MQRGCENPVVSQKIRRRKPGIKYSRVCACLLMLALSLLALLPFPPRQVQAGQSLQKTEKPISLSAQIFLPYISRQTFTSLETVFGVEVSRMTETSGAQQMIADGTSWVRFSWSGVQWSKVEPQPGVYDWNALSQLDEDLKVASLNNIRPLIVVRDTPDWAQEVPGTSCGAIRSDRLAAFADFMAALVSRYRQAPYHVHYWEIWNEPDVAPNQVAPDSVWGCWGDPNDAYFGGEYFGEMLSAIYPRIKETDPQAQVIVGGLLLDCDPEDPPAGKDCASSRFFEGVLKNGNGANFDGVAYHAYDYYMGSLGSYFNPNWHSSWNTSGSVSIVKRNYLTNLLDRYGISGKFLLNSENALICDICAGDNTFELTKAYYLTQVYGDALAMGLKANIWYKIFDWRSSGLLNSDLSPRPANTAFQFARSVLGNAVYRQNISAYPGVKGYEFQRGGQRVWLLWSADGALHSISLPNQPLAVYDALGQLVSVSTKLAIGLDPYFIEFPPQ